MEQSETSRMLTQLGLNQYITTFQENQIDDNALLALTKEDLKELVPSLGHRIQIWNVVEKLKSQTVYVCFVCKSECRSLIVLSSHLRIAHRLNSLDIYKCTHCESQYNRHSYLKHLRNVFKLHSHIFNNNAFYDPNVLEESIEIVESETSGVKTPNEETFIDLKLLALQLLASILQSGKIPFSSCDAIIGKSKKLISGIIQNVKLAIRQLNLSASFHHDVESALNSLNDLENPFAEFDTRYKLDKYLKNNGYIIQPQELVLDSDLAFTTRPSQSSRQHYKPVTMQYIPIKDSLSQLLNKPGFFSSLQFESSFSGEVYSCFRQGIQSQQFPKNTIFINIFYDDAEVANPLGSKAGKHKLANFYFSIADMQKHMQSSTDNIILLASVKSADYKISSPNAVAQVIVDELQDLWNIGITFHHNQEIINVKVALAQICGDNLGVHSLLGFSEGFTANWPCRRCKMHKLECQKAYQEDTSILRNLENYNEDVEKNCLSSTGINFNSVFNKLPYHHVTKMVAFDIMHDIFEGVGPDLIIHVINYGLAKKYFTFDKLNYRLESFDFGRHFNNVKPSLMKQSYLKGETKAGQNASQSKTLIHFLPLIFGDLIPTGDTVWNFFLLFQEIVNLLLSTEITEGGLVLLESLISEFLLNYQSIFSKNLKPKHHHMIHYPDVIREVGPLKLYWCMTFEAKHKFFKTTSHMICNFKNICKSVAYRHQLSRSFSLLEKNKFAPSRFSIPSYGFEVISEMQFSDLILERFGKYHDEKIKICNVVEYNGCDYKTGAFVLLKHSSIDPLFGEIIYILLEDNEINFLVSKVVGELVLHLGCFKIGMQQSVEIVDVNSLAFYLPLYSASSFYDNDTSQYIVLPVKYS